jgi:hypothetical protein
MKPVVARRMILLTLAIAGLAAIFQLLRNVSGWEPVAVSVVICTYGAWQLDRYLQRQSMMTSTGGTIPSNGDVEDRWLRHAYGWLWGVALSFGALNLLTGWML